MNFCSQCGGAVVRKTPAGDHLQRHCCTQCHNVHYQNPKIIVGTLPVWEDKILLCRRAIEPRYGLWTLPAGFMENDETTASAALRETAEEAHAKVQLIELHSLINVPRANQVHLLYRAALIDLNFHPGEESLETRLFSPNDIPWGDIAFRSIVMGLNFYYHDYSRSCFQFHTATVEHY
jgi:ADP-ribose pyrophosphatase YjhB (NUDIX family)